MTETGSARERLVEPITLKGFKDYLPEEMIPRNQVIQTIQTVYEKYGFVPIDTPVLEYLVTLIGTGGAEVNKQMFRLESPENEPIAMRFDLTVPFARVISQYPDKIKLPFRRYHIGPVFRADKPGPGRFRQFTQFDIDAAGCSSVVVDAEIVAAMCEALSALGLANDASRQADAQEYQVRINNRKVLDALLETCGLPHDEAFLPVLRVIDKLQKVGLENVRKELGEGRVDDSGDPIPGVGLDASTIDKILEFIGISGNSRNEVTELGAKLLADSALSRAAIQEMRDLADALDGLGVSETEAVFDPSLMRGLDYYTGPVFEAFLPFAPEFGSVMGGGRFDGLVERFLESSVPATGASIGLDRLMAALTLKGKVSSSLTTSKAIVLVMKGVPAAELLRAAQELRRGGVPAEIYMSDSEASMGSQLSYANAKGIPVAVIIGPDELAAGTVAIKDLEAGKKARAGIEGHEEYKKAGKRGQTVVPREELAGAVQDLLNT